VSPICSQSIIWNVCVRIAKEITSVVAKEGDGAAMPSQLIAAGFG
jgi:hypothetical protein